MNPDGKVHGAICLVDANQMIHRLYHMWAKQAPSRRGSLEVAVARAIGSVVGACATTPFGRKDWRHLLPSDQELQMESQLNQQLQKEEEDSPLGRFLSATGTLEDSSQQTKTQHAQMATEKWSNDVVFAFDSGFSLRKLDFPEYKAKRPAKAPDLLKALDLAQRLVTTKAFEIDQIRSAIGPLHWKRIPRAVHILPEIEQISPSVVTGVEDVEPGRVSAEADDLIYTFIRRLRDPMRQRHYSAFSPQLLSHQNQTTTDGRSGRLSPPTLPPDVFIHPVSGAGVVRLRNRHSTTNAAGTDSSKLQPHFADGPVSVRPISVTTNDFDLSVLMQFPDVVLHNTKNEEVVTPQDVEQRYNVNLEHIPTLKTVMGDPADSIPGLPEIGHKKAVALLQKYNFNLNRLMQEYRQDFGNSGAINTNMKWVELLSTQPDYLATMEKLVHLRWVDDVVPSIDRILSDINKSALRSGMSELEIEEARLKAKTSENLARYFGRGSIYSEGNDGGYGQQKSTEDAKGGRDKSSIEPQLHPVGNTQLPVSSYKLSLSSAASSSFNTRKSGKADQLLNYLSADSIDVTGSLPKHSLTTAVREEEREGKRRGGEEGGSNAVDKKKEDDDKVARAKRDFSNVGEVLFL